LGRQHRLGLPVRGPLDALHQQQDAGRIKAAISAKLAGAQCLLVIVGQHTASSPWVAWEIAKAAELGLSLVGAKIDRSYASPAGLLGAGASWAYAFDRDPIVKALNDC